MRGGRRSRTVGDLLTGAVDYLICEQGEAAMSGALLGGMVTIHAFPEEVRIGLVYGPEGRPAWASDLRAWLAEWRKTDDARRLRARYAGDGFAACVADIVPPCRVVGGISVWDELFRRVGAREAVDWRLLAAIAYHESHFRDGVRSGAGAVGMMQIMPVTARHLGIGASQLSDPETNVTAAARLLEEIEAQLALADSMDAEEKLRIVLAAYNSGVGTVRNARRLAEAEGSDADLWETVADYLALMGDRTYRNDSIPYRRFRAAARRSLSWRMSRSAMRSIAAMWLRPRMCRPPDRMIRPRRMRRIDRILIHLQSDKKRTE